MIVARDARDYAWVLARTPMVLAAEWAPPRVAAQSYDTSKLREIPEAWPPP